MSSSILTQQYSPSLSNAGSSAQLPPHTPMCEEETKPFRDVCVVKVLNKAKFPVYLVNSKANKQDYAMKVFPFAGAKAHPYFHNEARFSFVNHPNVIRTHHVEPERETVSQSGTKKVSYTVMEYAPYGDFFDLLVNHGGNVDDKLIRTYFRQLVEGLEYLHDSGVSHMDLKLENLLLGENFNLKIADFDLSYIAGDNKIISKGTKFYRAPEIIQGRCMDTKAADIYSAGIILFTLKTRGMLPHAEDSYVAGVDFAGLLYTQNDEFWKKHCEVQKKDASYFDDDFKDLFHAMIQLNPARRASIEQIKQSKWYNGPCYSDEELKACVGKLYGINH